jgi:hypothetical protein
MAQPGFLYSVLRSIISSSGRIFLAGLQSNINACAEVDNEIKEVELVYAAMSNIACMRNW